jgi:hypothetical protein
MGGGKERGGGLVQDSSFLPRTYSTHTHTQSDERRNSNQAVFQAILSLRNFPILVQKDSNTNKESYPHTIHVSSLVKSLFSLSSSSSSLGENI